MRYPEFADRFLAAVYWETEQTGRDYHDAGSIVQKYNLDGKPQWIGRVADEWEHFYFKDVSKVLAGYDGWSFRVSGQGARKIEDDFPTERELKAFLGLPSNASDDLDDYISQLAPASGRLVTTKDNQPKIADAKAEIFKVRETLRKSNELDEAEKSAVDGSLEAAEVLLEKSDSWLLGAMNYLVFERLKKAFERTIEDSLRAIIIASLGTLLFILLGLI